MWSIVFAAIALGTLLICLLNVNQYRTGSEPKKLTEIVNLSKKLETDLNIEIIANEIESYQFRIKKSLNLNEKLALLSNLAFVFMSTGAGLAVIAALNSLLIF